MAWSLEEAIGYYQKQGAPKDQNALISLLREIQQECGNVPRYALSAICDAYGIKEGVPIALIKRIPSLRLGDGHCLELCAGPNCGKHKALAACAESLQKKYGFTLKFSPCMRMCGKGPNIRWDGKLYNGATEDLLQKLAQDSK